MERRPLVIISGKVQELPLGDTIPGGEEVAQVTKRIDFDGDTIIYSGIAAPGTAEAATSWMITRTTFVGEDVVVEYAGGTAAYDKAWTLRTSYTYS
jgi:hypothetical protein